MNSRSGGFLSSGDREVVRPLVHSLLTHDDYMLLADYQAYVNCQQRVSDANRDQVNRTRMSILNTARVGRFSSGSFDSGLLPRYLEHQPGVG